MSANPPAIWDWQAEVARRATDRGVAPGGWLLCELITDEVWVAAVDGRVVGRIEGFAGCELWWGIASGDELAGPPKTHAEAADFLAGEIAKAASS